MSTHRFYLVKFWVFTHKMKMQCSIFSEMMSFLSSRVSVSGNCKQSITVWFFTMNVLRITDIVVKLGRTYQWENCLTTTNCACRRFVSNNLVQKRSLFSSYPDKGWKLGTVKKVCSRVDRTGSAVLRKQGNGELATASAWQFVVVRQFSYWY